MQQAKTHKEDGLQIVIGKVLRYGVWLSACLTALGLILLLMKPQSITESRFPEVAKRFSLNQFFNELIQLQPFAVLTLGILVLLCTPVLRVCFAIVGYLREKDWLYFFISLLVLIILIVSFAICVAH